MKDLLTYLVIAPVAFIAGAITGLLITRYILRKQAEEWQKQMETPDKDQVRNMLSAMGQKPSEEQVNRFINMAENVKKKKVKKITPKKKK